MESTFINMKRSFEYVGDNSTFQKRITLILAIQWVLHYWCRLPSLSWSTPSLSFLRPLSFCAEYRSRIFSLYAPRLLHVPLSILILLKSGRAPQISSLAFIKFRFLKNFIFIAIIPTVHHGLNQPFSLEDLSVVISSVIFHKESAEGRSFILSRLNLLFILVIMTISIIFCALVPTF